MAFLAMLILTSSILCCLMNHPLTLGFILLIQTIMIAMMTGLMSLNFWSSYIIFLVMIGGLLILFIYMTSIASNEKFKFSPIIVMIIIISMATTLSMLILDKFLVNQKLKMIETFSIQENINSNLFLNKFINFPHSMIYLLIVVYLLITLIAIVKISSKTKSTLRKKF
uniref:NADH-ubiquinone oxidoreductase chain 6 n=1 Tax=Cryptocephalus sp. CRY01 TaxID=1205548 RepID=A0A0S2MQP3_9CUCU|nr:NADH deshydrogenase subunit 6 [Cryptocephalus sp. CRY01]